MAKAKRPPDLDNFRQWLGDRGLTRGTEDVYVRDIDKAFSLGGIVSRLRDDGLAPKTRRHILAAARRWADFTDDTKLTKTLKEIRLPPPLRKTAPIPLPRQQLFELVDELAKADYLSEPMRGVLGMMACRGLRCGDVLRLQKHELHAARDHGTLAFEAKGRKRMEFKVLKTYRRHLLLLANAPGNWNRVDELVSPHAKPKGRRTAAARAVERALTEVGVKIGIFGLYPHRLRRTYAVEYLRTMKGDPEALIKLTEHMRWASMATAMEYVNHARGDELDIFAEKIFER